MAGADQEPTAMRRSSAYRDFRLYRRRISRHLASLKAAGIDEAKNSRLASEDQFDLPGDLLAACDYVERFITLSNARMEHGDEQEKAAVADMNFLLGGILRLIPSTARHIDVAGSAVERDRSEEAARRAARRTALAIEAAESLRGLVEGTSRDPNAPDRPAHPGATWAAMRDALGDDIDEKTARKYRRHCTGVAVIGRPSI